MKVFEVSSGELAGSFEGHTSSVLGVSWRADGRVLATCGADKVVKVWDFLTGELTKTIAGFDKEVTAIEFMGSSDNMMCSSGDKKVSTKNTGGGNVRNFGGPVDFMYSVRSSADGKVIAAGGQDSIVRVWSENGQTIINFEPPTPNGGSNSASVEMKLGFDNAQQPTRSPAAPAFVPTATAASRRYWRSGINAAGLAASGRIETGDKGSRRPSQVLHLHPSIRRIESARFLGHEAQRAAGDSRSLRTDFDSDSWISNL